MSEDDEFLQDPEAVAEAEAADKRAAFLDAEDTADFDFMLSNERGRAFLWTILSMCKVFSSSFTGDALTSAYGEGKRAIGVALLARLQQHNPSAYAIMQAENTARLARIT